MDLLSGYASSDDDEQGAAEHVQPRPAPRATTALPDAASLLASTSLPAGQLAGRCDLAVSCIAGVALWLTQLAPRVRAADCQQPATDTRGQKRSAVGALLRPEQPKGVRCRF